MKRLKSSTRIFITAALTAAMVCALLSLCFIPAFSISKDRFTVCDKSGIYICESGSDYVNVREVYPESSGYTYSTDGRIIALCIFSGDVYIIKNSTEQDLLRIVDIYRGGKLIKSVKLAGLRLNSKTMMAADSKGNIYTIDADSYLRVFDRAGRELYKSERKYYNIIPFENYPLCVGADGLYFPGNNSEKKISGATPSGAVRRVSDSFISDDAQDIYNIYTGERFAGTGSGAAVCGKYLVVAFGNELRAYNKSTGNYSARYEAKSGFDYIGSYKDKVVLFDFEGNVSEIIGEKDFSESNEEAKSPSTENEEDKTQAVGLDFGEYKASGKYIYLPPSIKNSTFHKNISHPGYDAYFSGSPQSGAGTGRTVTFKRENEARKFIFVVVGDITGEGNVNTMDITKLTDILLKQKKLKGAFRLAADINSDGRISNADLVLMAQKYKGIG